MIETHQIIVLGTTKYSDDRIIVNALSRTAARVTLIVRITNSKRAAVRHTLFQPMALLEVQWEATPRATMLRPKAARPLVPLLSLQTDPLKASVAMFLAEFLTHATRSDFDGGIIYDYIAYAMEWLDAADHGFNNFHLVFLMRLMRFFGIEPNLDTPAYYFDLEAGTYSPVLPAHAYYIRGAEAEVLPTLLRLNFGTMHVMRLTGEQRSRILQAIVTYYRLHLPGIPALKSLDVLRSVFS